MLHRGLYAGVEAFKEGSMNYQFRKKPVTIEAFQMTEARRRSVELATSAKAGFTPRPHTPYD